MKYLLILPIVLISLCVQIPEISLPVKQGGNIIVDTESPDIFVQAKTLSSEIKGGRTVQLYFELRNRQSYELSDVYFEVYDHPCFPDGGPNAGKFSKDVGTIRTNQSIVWSWRWTTDTSTIDRQCLVKFLTSYEATNYISQDLAILSESEYFQREVDGTLNEIPIQSTSAKGPLNVYVTFADPQPLMANQTAYFMTINYFNTGKGFFVEPGGAMLTLNPPSNIQNLICGDDYLSVSGDCAGTATSCDQFLWDGAESNCIGQQLGCTDPTNAGDPCSGNPTECWRIANDVLCTSQEGCSWTTSDAKLVLQTNSLKFIKGKALPTYCSFDTKQIPTVDIKSFTITTNYKYVLYNSIPIMVKA